MFGEQHYQRLDSQEGVGPAVEAAYGAPEGPLHAYAEAEESASELPEFLRRRLEEWSGQAPQRVPETMVRCPLCGQLAPRPRTVIGALPLLAGGIVALLYEVSKHFTVAMRPGAWVVLVTIGLMFWPLVAAIARWARLASLPEDCPHCHGPLRTAVTADWGRTEWQDGAYLQSRWSPPK